MMNFTYHATDAGSVFHLDDLMDAMEAKGLECALLIDGSANLTLDLLNLNCCHNDVSLSVKYFVHADATLTGDGESVANL